MKEAYRLILSHARIASFWLLVSSEIVAYIAEFFCAKRLLVGWFKLNQVNLSPNLSLLYMLSIVQK